AAGAAKAGSVPINTIAYGTPTGTVELQGQRYLVPADPSAMAMIADQSGGKTFSAQTANQLSSIYGQIAKTIGYDTRQHEITAWFTGLGLAVAGLAAIAALIWTQRLT